MSRIRSNFVGCSMGRSAGGVPLKIRSTKLAARAIAVRTVHSVDEQAPGELDGRAYIAGSRCFAAKGNDQPLIRLREGVKTYDEPILRPA